MSEQEKTHKMMGSLPLDTSIGKVVQSGVMTLGDWPNDTWWDLFESPILSSWIEEGLRDNPSLQSMQCRVESAQQKAVIARAKRFPFVGFAAQDDWSYLSKNGLTHALNPLLPRNGYQIDLSFSFEYEFDFWGKYRNLFYAAMGEAKAQEAELAEAKLIFATVLSQSYFTLLLAQKKAELYRNLYEIQESKWRLQEKLETSALSSNLSPLLDREKARELQQKFLSAEDEIIIQKHRILTLMGKNPDDDLELPSEFPLLQKMTIPSTLSCDLLARRPDICAHIWRIEALAAKVGAAKSEFFPSINLAALAGLQSLHLSNLFTLSSGTADVTPALHLPIFTAGSIRAHVRETQALFSEAVAQYNEKVLQSAQEVVDAVTLLRTAYEQVHLQEDVVAASHRRLMLTQMRKESALDNQFSIWKQQEEWIKTKLQQIERVYDQVIITIHLIQALGGGFQYTPPISIRSCDAFAAEN